jgi:5-methylcytosine-specific restriction endonuclease McrA
MFKYEKPLYAKRDSVAKRTKKATKTLVNLAKNDPVLKAIIEEHISIATRTAVRKAIQSKQIKYQPGMRDDFYKTREWRELRYQVLVKNGKQCQCCGNTKGYLHVDHIKPRSIYPSMELDINNLQVLCEDCNIGKSNRDMTDWRQQ